MSEEKRPLCGLCENGSNKNWRADWILVAADRAWWLARLNTTMNIVSINADNLLTGFSGGGLLNGVS
jgi:hypothetical protein